MSECVCVDVCIDMWHRWLSSCLHLYARYYARIRMHTQQVDEVMSDDAHGMLNRAYAELERDSSLPLMVA